MVPAPSARLLMSPAEFLPCSIPQGLLFTSPWLSWRQLRLKMSKPGPNATPASPLESQLRECHLLPCVAQFRSPVHLVSALSQCPIHSIMSVDCSPLPSAPTAAVRPPALGSHHLLPDYSDSARSAPTFILSSHNLFSELQPERSSQG